MENSIEYVFESEMIVYCFLNMVKYMDVDVLWVKFGCSDYYVFVGYCVVMGEFDLILFKLDDLVRELNG